MSYREFIPAVSLQPYIYCFWELKTSEPLKTPFHYRVVADGCIDIIIDLNDPKESIVMGFHNVFNEFNLHSEFNYVGIRFLPAMFPLFFSVNANDLTNAVFPLNDVVSKIASFIHNNIGSELGIHRILRQLDRYFTIQSSNPKQNSDSRIFNAINHIFSRHGVLSIEHEIDTGLSSRQMRRLFKFYVGDSPKGFSRVIRFQNILNAKPSLQSLRQNKLFYDAGYYDQAHFIKEFRQLYGVTPSKAFQH